MQFLLMKNKLPSLLQTKIGFLFFILIIILIRAIKTNMYNRAELCVAPIWGYVVYLAVHNVWVNNLKQKSCF